MGGGEERSTFGNSFSFIFIIFQVRGLDENSYWSSTPVPPPVYSSRSVATIRSGDSEPCGEGDVEEDAMGEGRCSLVLWRVWACMEGGNTSEQVVRTAFHMQGRNDKCSFRGILGVVSAAGW